MAKNWPKVAKSGQKLAEKCLKVLKSGPKWKQCLKVSKSVKLLLKVAKSGQKVAKSDQKVTKSVLKVAVKCLKIFKSGLK